MFHSYPESRAMMTDLARRITRQIGTAEVLITSVPGLSLHRRTGPTVPCSATYMPGVIVIAQGSKQVDLGGSTFTYDAKRYLLTSIDLPVITRVVEASEDKPCLALSLKLEMPSSDSTFG